MSDPAPPFTIEFSNAIALFVPSEVAFIVNLSEPFPNSKEEWVKLALENNYQLKAADLRKKAAKSNARSAASDRLPKIDIVGAGSESETNQFNYEGFSINAVSYTHLTLPTKRIV